MLIEKIKATAWREIFLARVCPGEKISSPHKIRERKFIR
jgi:hypothetical protein